MQFQDPNLQTRPKPSSALHTTLYNFLHKKTIVKATRVPAQKTTPPYAIKRSSTFKRMDK